MTLYDFSIIFTALIVLGTLRFGIPALIMWVLNVLNHRYVHA